MYFDVILIVAVLGGAFGAFRAARAKRPTLDILQFAVVHALALALLSAFVMVILRIFV